MKNLSPITRPQDIVTKEYVDSIDTAKQDKDTNAVDGNIAVFNDGQTEDSGCNIVTAIDSDSTDNEIPSAKAVYDTTNNMFVRYDETQILTAAQKSTACSNIGAITTIDITDFKQLQSIVRAGQASVYAPVGTSIPVKRGSDTLNFRVRAIDYDPLNLGLGHNIVLEMDKLWGTGTTYRAIQFDAKEAFYATDAILPAGTYNFLLGQHSWVAADVGKYFQFTLTEDVPINGQFIMNQAYNVTLEGATIDVFASPSTTTRTERVTMTEGQGGTYLGELKNAPTGNFNSCQRAFFGSNNYYQSAFRQWANSDKVYNQIWEPQTKFDRPPSWATDSNFNGFVYGLDTDFVDIVSAQSLPCRTNSVGESNSLDGKTFAINQVYNIQDKFFLLSRPEIYGTYDSTSYKDGTILTAYNGLADIDRIKYDVNGAAHSAWLRSPSPGGASSQRFVYATTGAVGHNGAVYANGVALACIIA